MKFDLLQVDSTWKLPSCFDILIQTKSKCLNGNAENAQTNDENDEPMNENLADIDDLEEEEDQQKGPPKLFIMNLVNSYGNAQLEQLENDGQPLQITSK